MYSNHAQLRVLAALLDAYLAAGLRLEGAEEHAVTVAVSSMLPMLTALGATSGADDLASSLEEVGTDWDWPPAVAMAALIRAARSSYWGLGCTFSAAIDPHLLGR
jgi:hypothetical protein